MIEPEQLERSKAIQKRTGRTFHFATRLLPERIRHATYVLYAFFRITDDVVDDPDPPLPEVQLRELDTIRTGALGSHETGEPVLDAFQAVRDRYGIPPMEVEEFVSAMARDVSTDRYETHGELEGYLRGSSVAVAYMMVAIMEPDDAERTLPHAKALGEAFQLTNFLRDVREDVLEYGRVYLPLETLERHGATYDQIERLEFTEGFAEAMRSELSRTETLYRFGVDGIDLLPADCRFAVLSAAVLYADHHRLIRARGYDVLSHRPTLGVSRRLSLLARTWWYWRRCGDPRSVFEAVSEFESPTDREPGERPSPGGMRASVPAWVGRVLGTVGSGLSLLTGK